MKNRCFDYDYDYDDDLAMIQLLRSLTIMSDINS